MARVSKRFCIISSVVATIITLVLIILSLYVLITSKSTFKTVSVNETSKPPFITLTEGLIFTTTIDEIWAWDSPTNTTHLLVSNRSEPILAFDNYGDQTVYYSASGSRHPIVSVSTDYKSLQYPGDSWYASALAVETLGGNVYVYDDKGRKIDVFDVKSQRHGILMADLEDVKDIELDPYRSRIFLLHSKSISMANIDGTNLEAIVKEDRADISAFALDLANTTVYWSTNTHITRYNYTDKKLTVIASSTCIVTSLGILGDLLYFTCQDQAVTNLFVWIITKDKCNDVESLNLNNVQKIRAYGPAYLPESKTSCNKANGGCGHYCLPSGAKHNCACAVGWRLDANDGSSCKPVTEYLVYLKDNYVRGQVLDQKTFTEAIVPRPTRLMSFVAKGIIDIDYDARRQYVVFSDDHGLYRQNLTFNSTSQVLQLGYLKDDLILSPTVDWISNQIYYFRYNTIEKFYSLVVQKADHFSDTENQRELYRFEPGLKPNALVLAQHRGFVFFTMYNESSKKTKLCQQTTTGVDLTVLTLPGNYSMSEVALAIDYDGDRFYWFDEERGQVHTNLVNGTIASFDVSMVENPVRISVHGAWLYISSSKTTHYINKLDGTYGGQVLFSGPTSDSWLSAAKVISERQQPIRVDHPCVKNNGGCTRYCFGVPDRRNGLTRVCG